MKSMPGSRKKEMRPYDKGAHDCPMCMLGRVVEHHSPARLTSQPVKWIQGAITHPGALTQKADKAGMSPMAFARAHAGASGVTGKQARLALTLSKLRKG